MKKHISSFLAIILLLLLTLSPLSCSRNGKELENTEQEILTLSVKPLSPSNTKAATGNEDQDFENKINSITYFIFDAKGDFQTSITSSSNQHNTKVNVGKIQIWAVVNSPSDLLKNIRNVQELEQLSINLSEHHKNPDQGFILVGKKDLVIKKNTLNSCSIIVSRLVSRITIKKLSNKLSEEFSTSALVLKNIFLTNVVGNICLNGEKAKNTIWLSKFGRKDGGNKQDIIKSQSDVSAGELTFIGNYSQSIENGDSYFPRELQYLYLFPNDTEYNKIGWAPEFSPRFTRIVIEAEIKGDTYYYPINILGAKSNHSYALDITITRLGTADPDAFEWATCQDVSIELDDFEENDEDQEINY